ncbi:MAG TPA: hypothetical protein VJN18_11165 [Polyangiaceae bacterium]|nr:hypothetical protein [Polyangiaceae bacterium]
MDWSGIRVNGRRWPKGFEVPEPDTMPNELAAAEMRRRFLVISDLFCCVKSFPLERLDWIEWLLDLHSMLSVVFHLDNLVDAERVHAFSPNMLDAARRVVALLYSDARGSTPWGSATPTPVALAAVGDAAMTRRGVEALERIASHYSKLVRFWGRDQPTNDLIEFAQRIVELLAKPTPHRLHDHEQALATARELERRLRFDTLEAGALPANELCEVLRDLPEGERAALRTFEGISARVRSAFEAFWCAS